MPSSTKLIVIKFCLSWVFEESAYVWANHWNSKHVHVKHSTDRVSHMFPCCPVISSPMSSKLTRSWKGWSRKNERSFLVCMKRNISLFWLFVSIEGMKIVFNPKVFIWELGTILSVKRYCLILKILWVWSLRIKNSSPINRVWNIRS